MAEIVRCALIVILGLILIVADLGLIFGHNIMTTIKDESINDIGKQIFIMAILALVIATLALSAILNI